MAPARARATTPSWAWLAPAVCLVLVTLSLNLSSARNERSGLVTAMAGGSNILASLPLNREPGMELAPEALEQKWNSWSHSIFDSTMTGLSLSTTGSFQLRKTKRPDKLINER